MCTETTIFIHDDKFESEVSLKIMRSGKYMLNRPFPSPHGPLFQNEGRCSAFDMEIIFHYHANKTHFHKKGCALSFILKVRVFGTQKGSFINLKPCRFYVLSRLPGVCYTPR